MTSARFGGAVIAALLIFLIFGTLAAVAWRAESLSSLSARDWAAVRFTLWQALLSAVLSVLFAIPVARALARRQFWGRGVLITLLGAPFILPVIVAILGLLAVFGRSGLMGQGFGLFGLEPPSIYGLHGVMLAHVFFNMPLATRLILQGWMSIPGERFRLAQSLGFSWAAMFLHIEWPMLRQVVPGVLMVIFLICVTSFAVALTLGGGPKATTIELAIYQAFRFDFDLSKAALLGLLQFAICGAVALLSLWVALPASQSQSLDRIVERNDGSVWLDASVIVLAALFLLGPLVSVLLRGVWGLPGLGVEILLPLWRSTWVAVVSAVLTILVALGLLEATHALSRPFGRALELLGYMSVAASPLVIGTGLFILTFRFVNPVDIALWVTVSVNAAMSLPFALRALSPALSDTKASYGRLGRSLGLTGWAGFRLVTWPRLRRPIGFSAGLAAALSMGDLGVITLFSDSRSATLPLTMYRMMEAYRMDEAYALALVLVSMSLGLFWAFDRGGRAYADA